MSLLPEVGLSVRRLGYARTRWQGFGKAANTRGLQPASFPEAITARALRAEFQNSPSYKNLSNETSHQMRGELPAPATVCWRPGAPLHRRSQAAYAGSGAPLAHPIRGLWVGMNASGL